MSYNSSTSSQAFPQKPIIMDRTCHGVQQTINAPRIIVIVRSAFRARFSIRFCCLCSSSFSPDRPCLNDVSFSSKVDAAAAVVVKADSGTWSGCCGESSTLWASFVRRCWWSSASSTLRSALRTRSTVASSAAVSCRLSASAPTFDKCPLTGLNSCNWWRSSFCSFSSLAICSKFTPGSNLPCDSSSHLISNTLQ